jgi:hypothetical protein
MQVELTTENLKKIEEYRAVIRQHIPSFNPSVTALANEGISEYFDGAIDLQKKINPTNKKK